MTMLIAGLLIFLGVHSVRIFAEPWRTAMRAKLGGNAFKGLYSVLSLVGFALIVWGYGLARQQPVLLYSMPSGFRHLAALLMLPVFVLLFAAYLPGRIQTAAKHPMLLAVKLWALAHLLGQSATGGTLADVALFGGFLAWAVMDRISVKRRAAAGLLRSLPLGPPRALNDAIALVGGLVVYAVFAFWLHAVLFGVRPFG